MGKNVTSSLFFQLHLSCTNPSISATHHIFVLHVNPLQQVQGFPRFILCFSYICNGFIQHICPYSSEWHCWHSECSWCDYLHATDDISGEEYVKVSNYLTHWGQDKMDAILQTFSNAFSWMKLWISLKFSLKFVPAGPINNIPALVQIMAWYRPGNKPLSEPMMSRLPTHICVTWPQWVKYFKSNLICTYYNNYLIQPLICFCLGYK